MRVLVTGASGFVGAVLCQTLSNSGHLVRATVRSAERRTPEGIEKVVTGDVADADWGQWLQDVQCVIHTAALAHVSDIGSDVDRYMQTNARATQRLATAAARAGVSRLIYLSSIKVNGEGAPRAYREQDEPNPQDAYGRSKWLGEKYAMEGAAARGMGVVIVRAPLVYGAGVRANFLRLMDWIDREWPLPLAAVNNRRSLVSVWNLCDLLGLLLTHDAAPGRLWMVSDDEDLSTPELVRRIAGALKRRARLFPVPSAVLRGLGALTGRRRQFARLCDSLTVDDATTRSVLGWAAPVTVDEGIARTAQWYRSTHALHGA